MMKTKISLAGLAVVAAAGVGLWSLAPHDSLLPLTPAMAQDTTAPGNPATAQIDVKDMTLGQDAAPVTMIEYASFTCPHCADFHATVFDNLKKDYIDTGKVKFVAREVYFDRYGLWATMIARCGGDMRYFGISDILYDTQREWAATDDPNVAVANLKKIGRTAGMDDAQMDVCLKDGAMAQALVDRNEVQMKEFDVKGTPTIIINGTSHSNMTYTDLKVIIDAELAK
jgi:protein-disulfide isomerase